MIHTYTLHGIHFEWDREKALTNFEKHGISFETACEAFFDPFVVAYEEQQAAGEFREVILGLTTQWQLLAVVQHDEIWRDRSNPLSAASNTNRTKTL